ncbi:MAG: S1 RNA-binding domain-containing protein, partial [Polyangiaceae bacterium]|nr:S1 RNA-binding domain-containing protein [Polyangiaceae bacterium]
HGEEDHPVLENLQVKGKRTLRSPCSPAQEGHTPRPMSDFASLFEDASQKSPAQNQPLEAGSKVQGTVLEISGGLVVLDIGGSADATLDLQELSDRVVQVGDKITATVKNARSDGPELTLSLGKGGGGIDVDALKLALESETPVAGSIKESVKGGFVIDLNGVRAFCPISQIDSSFVNEPEVFVGQSADFLILEIKEGGRNIVVSRRKLLDAERLQAQEQIAATLEVGSDVQGTIREIVKHGVVVDIGGAEGFIHISELARRRVERAEDVVSIGETVQVKVLRIEKDDRGLNIRLSLKALDTSAPQESAKDEILESEVVRHTNSGVIVATKIGEGLVPSRELDLAPGADHRRALPVGTPLKVVLVSKDGRGKIRFSVTRVAQVEERSNYRSFSKETKAKKNLGSLGDLMASQFGALSALAAAHPVPEKPAPQVKTSPAPAKKDSTSKAKATSGAPAPAPQEPGTPAPASGSPQANQPAPAPEKKPQKKTHKGVVSRRRS